MVMTEAEVDGHSPSQGCFDPSFGLDASVRLNSESMPTNDARKFLDRSITGVAAAFTWDNRPLNSTCKHACPLRLPESGRDQIRIQSVEWLLFSINDIMKTLAQPLPKDAVI